MNENRNSSVLVVIEGHTTAQTGELVYQPPGRKGHFYALPEKVNPTKKNAFLQKYNVWDDRF